MTSSSSLHNTTTADVEKNAPSRLAGAPAYESREGGAPFNMRNITPGGHTLDTSQPAFPTYHRRFANPAPLGLSAFALTTFLLSLINVGARGVSVPNVVVGPALFYGGLGQLLAGMWEFACGNTFGATAFTSYGGFWMSYAFIVSPWSAIGAAYADAVMFTNGVAFFLFGWFIFTFIMLIASLRSSIALSGVFFWLTITFLLLAIAELGVGNASAIQTAGGAFGLITAFNGWYVAAAGLLTPTQAYFTLPIGDIPRLAPSRTMADDADIVLSSDLSSDGEDALVASMLGAELPARPDDSADQVSSIPPKKLAPRPLPVNAPPNSMLSHAAIRRAARKTTSRATGKAPMKRAAKNVRMTNKAQPSSSSTVAPSLRLILQDTLERSSKNFREAPKDPFLHDLPFPFSIEARLEEVRLVRRAAPFPRLVQSRFSIAFRHATQSWESAARCSLITSTHVFPKSTSLVDEHVVLTERDIPIVANLQLNSYPCPPSSNDELVELMLHFELSEIEGERIFAGAVPLTNDGRIFNEIAPVTQPMLYLPSGFAPTPSLIPHLDDPPITDPPASFPSFEPLPRFQQIAYTTRAVPYDGSPLESYPLLSTWENSASTNAYVEAKMGDIMNYEPESDDDEATRQREEEWRKENMVSRRALEGLDNGYVQRDFVALGAMIGALGIDKADLAQAAEDVGLEGGASSWQELLCRDRVLEKACKLYGERMGQSGAEAQHRFRLLSEDEAVPIALTPDVCQMCGALFCTIHDRFKSFNKSTMPPPRVPPIVDGGCPHCRSTRCLKDKVATSPRSNSDQERAEKLLAEGNPSIDPCSASLILERPFYEARSCRNLTIQQQQHKATQLGTSTLPCGGFGLFMVETAEKGDVLGVYGGESFAVNLDNWDESAVYGVLKEALSERVLVSYWFTLDGSHAVDSDILGSNMRFINHSTGRPNCVAGITYVSGTHQIAITATKSLQPGEELFLDYGQSYGDIAGANIDT
ncbi:hypothetical protein JCM1841_003464 [Sporobolomyces salmonicolor]